VILLAASLALAPAATARLGFRGFVAAYAVALAAWLPLVRVRARLSLCIAVAIALRLLFLFREPMLSGDVYRYLSDGAVVAGGGNPYAYTPSDPRVNHRDIRSIYPPLAQFLFGAVHELTGWRLLIMAGDVAVIVALRRRGALAFATCPFVIVEGVWSGHIDALAGALVAFAIASRSGVLTGLATGLKVIPGAAAAPLYRETAGGGRRLRFALGFAIAVAVPFIPFARGPIMPGFREYATRWIFNSPLYEVIRACVQLVPTKAIWTHHPLRFEAISDVVYRYLYPDFLTRAILAVIALAAIVTARRATEAIAALLICSPAIHPWYWLTLVPASILERRRWLAVAVIAPVSYLLYEGAPSALVYVWFGAAIAAALQK
jgi:hypothetical protein